MICMSFVKCQSYFMCSQSMSKCFVIVMVKVHTLVNGVLGLKSISTHFVIKRLICRLICYSMVGYSFDVLMLTVLSYI